MKLSHDEEVFLRHWIYDEWHYQEGRGPAKRLQLEHKVVPADLAMIIAASMRDLGEQEAAAEGPPPDEPPVWPWAADACAERVVEARSLLDLLLPHDSTLAPLRRSLASPTKFAVEYRYPGVRATTRRMAVALRRTDRVRRELRERLGLLF